MVDRGFAAAPVHNGRHFPQLLPQSRYKELLAGSIMRFTPSLLDEIKARLPVSQVVGRRVRLVKAGREWKGLSPFNAEKTPSFFVNDQKQAWFDFSSGKNGNVFDFVMESEGLSFPEAVERLAAEAGVPLPARSADAERQEKKRAGLFDVMEMAAAYFEKTLKGQQGQAGRDYLAGRGVDEACRAEFRIGLAISERHALRDHLAGRSVDVATLVEAGLLISGEDIPVAYDRFRNRVMFPIQDLRGRIIAFGGRTLDKDAPAKYLNSPETPLFHKGSLLFNHHRARKGAHDKGRVIVVEGYMDVIAMAGAGFPETVAPLGTALTEEQMALLWRMASEPILCFDGDSAGQRAAFRAVDLALARLEPGKSVRFAFLPQGQDPDDLVRSAGARFVEGLLTAARPLSDVLWMRETAAAPLDTPERRAALERRLRETVARISDPVARRHYEADIDQRLEAFTPRRRGRRMPMSVDQARTGSRGHSGPSQKWREGLAPRQGLAPPGPGVTTFGAANPGTAQEALIVLGIDARHELLAELAEELSSLAFSNPDAREMARALLDAYAFEGEEDVLFTTPDSVELDKRRARLRQMLRPGDERFLTPEASPALLEEAVRQAIGLHDLARALRGQLRDAERALAAEQSEVSLASLQSLREACNVVHHASQEDEGQDSVTVLDNIIARTADIRRR
jgi:DNA primase